MRLLHAGNLAPPAGTIHDVARTLQLSQRLAHGLPPDAIVSGKLSFARQSSARCKTAVG